MTNNMHLPPSGEAQSYLAAIISSSDDAIISKDLNGNITSWNTSAERIFGYTAAEAIGRHITLIIPADRLSEEDKILTTLRTGERVDHFETLRRHKDGHLVTVSLTVSPIRDSQGKIIGASKVSRDISDRIKAEEVLRETSLKKDEFLANMSHELRTPMNAVIGLANILKDMKGMPDNARKFVDTLKISADNLMDLINDLLDFAKIESGSFEIEQVEFDLTEVVEKSIAVMNVKAQEKNLDLRINYAPDLPHYFIGDPLRMHQILNNLLSNAVKFTNQGYIQIDMTGRDDGLDATRITLKVSDTGIGIPDDKLAMIFDKFTQADSSVTRKYGGTGLGLAITKACIEKMDGSISVQSVVGAGTSFVATFTLKKSADSAILSCSVDTLIETKREQKNVLLVEDYEPNVLVAGSLLEEWGYSYDVAANGFEALTKFARGKYDVILMDIQMHDLDGLEATRRIRQYEQETNRLRIPIIAMTAHVRDQDKNSCIEAGMDDFIPKPFESAMLFQKISAYIEPGIKLTQLVQKAK